MPRAIIRARRFLSVAGVWLTLSALLNHSAAYSQEHVVPLAEMERRLQTTSAERAANIADIERVLQLPAAREALKKANIGHERVHRAVAMLSQSELSQLARQARSAEQDVRGGLVVAILAIIGLIVVVIVVLNAIDRNKDILD